MNAEQEIAGLVAQGVPPHAAREVVGVWEFAAKHGDGVPVACVRQVDGLGRLIRLGPWHSTPRGWRRDDTLPVAD